MTREAVGVVGTGAMGMGIVRSLARHGVRTFSRDLRDEANALAAELGAHVCDSPAALAREVGVVLLVVVDDAQIEAVLFGDQGAADALRPRSVVVVCSTVDPTYVRALAPRLGSRGIAVVDAPLSGGPAKAAAGTMTMMVSGPPDARERCEPVFADIAGRVFVVGDAPGQAATFKIVNNLLAAANLAAGAEAIALAARAGIDPKAALDVVVASSGASWIVTDRMPRAFAHDAAVHAATKILAKDVGIAVALAERLGADATFARAASQAFRSAVEGGDGEADDAVLLRRAMEAGRGGGN